MSRLLSRSACLAAALLSLLGMSGAAQAQSEPYLGQIMCATYNFVPRGWAALDGQLMSIAQNTALFSLLGTTYGGDGRVTFALPDMRGRTPIHQGNGHTIGERAGETAHTLSINEMPQHLHSLKGLSSAASATIPS